MGCFSPSRRSLRSKALRLSWADVEWIRSVWDGPIVVKGRLIQGLYGCDRFKDEGCFISAFDAESGKHVQQIVLVPGPLDVVAPAHAPLGLLEFRVVSDRRVCQDLFAEAIVQSQEQELELADLRHAAR